MKHRMGTDDAHVFVDDGGRFVAAYVNDGSDIETEDIVSGDLVMLVIGTQRFIVREREEIVQ